MNKIATAEELQVELRGILAMTEEVTPSRSKLAAALFSLADRTADAVDTLVDIKEALKEKDPKSLKKILSGLGGLWASQLIVEAMGSTGARISDVQKLIGKAPR